MVDGYLYDSYCFATLTNLPPFTNFAVCIMDDDVPDCMSSNVIAFPNVSPMTTNADGELVTKDLNVGLTMIGNESLIGKYLKFSGPTG